MVFGDWTFDTTYYNTIQVVTDTAPGESAPVLKFQRNAVSSAAKPVPIYPASGTINGVSVLGLNQGQISSWFKDDTYAISSVSRVWKLLFRITDTASATYTGYSVEFNDDEASFPRHSDFSLKRWSNGVATTLDTLDMTANITSAVNWYGSRVTWWETASSGLLVKVEMNYNDGTGWIEQTPGLGDSTNSFKSSTNTVGFAVDRPVISSSTYRFDGLRVGRKS